MDGLASLLSPDAFAPAPTLDQRERHARLRLAGTERVGPVTFGELLTTHGSARAALAALPDLAAAAGLAHPPRVPSHAEIAREAQSLTSHGGRHLVIGDADYPAALAALPDAPPVLRCLGGIDLLQRPMIAIVGARNASANGRRLAADFARDLAQAGLVVVSGLARGIDAAAQHAALQGGTVAVLAGGVDNIYPPENEALYRQIAAEGLVLSEMPWSVIPQARHFPRRNRIIAGLCSGVVVIEAALQSGSLITAQRAIDQGRDVFAVPGSPLDPRSRGCNRLLREGAHLVESAGDVLQLLGPGLLQTAASQKVFECRSASATSSPGTRKTRQSPAAPKRATDRAAHSQVSVNAGNDGCVSDRDRILECLGPAPTPVDEVVRRCQVSAAAVQSVLLELELAGRLERHRGNAVSLL